MAEKALVGGMYDIRKVGSVWRAYVSITITLGEDTSASFTVYPESPTFNPLLPNWRSRIATAAKDHALSAYGVTVDQIIFPDYGILGL